ncbi:MAG: hypothetical protein A3K19_09510 [Lentisphaerae bacterium RIFOXYB12_FULL_65_16]|nr:MAG: hypothetical protein A3K18_03530 [Lentisphaerae bacterium RIFOXYA12_64_32]OGV90488.1 MAG: hypothetical protein A3K19_09510 [Lentisphaerae bacterium RIFOXYB12_FULL_65_16]
MIYPSKLGLGLAGLLGVFYLIALQSRSGLLFLILGIIAGCFLLNTVGAWWSARALRLLPPKVMVGREGEAVTGSWRAENASRRAIGQMEIRGPWGELLHVRYLGPRESLHGTPALKLPTRGVYPFSSLAAICSYPYGLMRCRRKLAVAGQITVYPAVYPCTAPPAAGFEPMIGGRFAGRNRAPSGDSFHGVRPLQPQDPVKLIHWPSSVKGQGIMVKEFDQELSGRVGILLDASSGQAPDGTMLLDWGARAAASLVLAALDQGYQVEYVDVASLTALSVPPFSDADAVMEALARLQPQPGALTPDSLDAAAAHLPAKGSLCVVLMDAKPAILEHLTQHYVLTAHRRVSVYLPTTCTDIGTGYPFAVHHYGPRDILDQDG